MIVGGEGGEGLCESSEVAVAADSGGFGWVLRVQRVDGFGFRGDALACLRCKAAAKQIDRGGAICGTEPRDEGGVRIEGGE